nr:two-component regulator propeller domain-containing protein [uncultured Allomuricauda sp.]
MVIVYLLRTKLFFFVLFGFYLCSSQVNRAYFHELNIEGIPFNKTVNVLLEDSIGFLWIGTDNGLYRYDGHDLVAYRYDVFDKNSIPNNSINSIIEDDHGNLWIGSESYLIYFDRKQQSFKGYYKNSTHDILGKSKDGAIWANRKNNSLVKVMPHTNRDSIVFDTHFNYGGDKTLMNPDRPIHSFLQDDFGRYWLATRDGIFPVNEDLQEGYKSFDQDILMLKEGPQHTFLALAQNVLYVLGYQKEDRRLEVLEAYPDFKGSGNRHMEPTSFDIDPDNNTLWIGTTDGLIRGTKTNGQYAFGHFGPNSHSEGSFRSNRVNSVLVDHYGNLWLGSQKGISKYIGRNSIFQFQELGGQNNSENHLASALFLDEDKNIWLGINNDGLYIVKDNQSFKVCASDETIGVIQNDYSTEELFIGADDILLKSRRFDLTSKKVKFDTIRTYKKIVTAVMPISQNETWVGLWGKGIDIIHSHDKLSDFKKNSIAQLQGNHVSVFLKDKRGTIWIGTRGEGLYKIDTVKEEIHNFLPVETTGLSSNAILSLLETEDKIWIGTRGGGLNVYDQSNGTFEAYGKKHGLRSTTISSLQQDKKGNIWVSTQNGLARFDTTQKRFVNFGMEDGVMQSQFTFDSSAADSEKGILYFGCTNGFYIVNTENFQQTTIKPQTVITAFKTLGAGKDGADKEQESKSSNLPLIYNQQIVLPYNKNNIVVEFSSLDLTAPHKNEYAYTLEGINDYWIYTTASNRNANYNDLPPGEYTFKVKSTNSDGVWNEDPTKLSFSIAPPFWRSNIAYIIYTLLVLSIMWVSAILIRRWYRLKKNLVAETVSRLKDNQHNRMKMVFFTDISHELRTPLALIQGTIEKIIRQKHYALSPLTAQRIHNNSVRMSRLIKQIMDIRKFDVGEFKIQVAKGNIDTDILNIKNDFNDLANIYHIDYSLKTTEESIIGWYDTEILEKILFNLLSNAFKYTPEKGKILISLSKVVIGKKDFSNKGLRKGKYIECSVRDNGVGIAKEDLGFIFDRYYQSNKLPTNQVPGTGIGMELVQRLIDRHHGDIKVESEENVYTEFIFMLPIQKKHYKDSEISSKKIHKSKEANISSEFQLDKPVHKPLVDDPKVRNTIAPKVLLVEDNDELRAMLKEELVNEFTILEASNGKEGYDIAVSEQPQLIVSDILMPIEDGVSLLKRLKKNSDISHIPVIILTARGSHETKIECLSMGVDDFIEKPFSLEYVKWKIKNILSTRKQLKEKYSKIITAEPSDIQVESNDEKFIKKLVRIIENSLEDDLLSVEFLASEAGMSRANLYRKLQSILNDTPVNLIKQIRLKRAAQLLRNKTMYISEVAYRTGFSNQKYFSKCFSKQYGMCPSEYIKKYADKDKEDVMVPILNDIKP